MALNAWDKAHLRALALYERRIKALFDAVATDAARLGVSPDELTDRLFDWKDYPLAAKKMERLTADFATRLQLIIENGVKAEWARSGGKGDALCRQVMGEKAFERLTEEQRERYLDNHADALASFLRRKTAGLDLSQRVWRLTESYKSEIALALDTALREGKASNRLATDLKRFLNEPDKLFRRVRDKHGQLRLSKAAKAYHPGQGVYRSSYMNARRLAVTETNMAYRTADHLRWQSLDFVTGIEVSLSNNHNCKGYRKGTFRDICDDLQGRYPKDFKFTGWHPHCRCVAVPILKKPEEVAEDNTRIMQGKEPLPASDSPEAVKTMPKAFTDWTKQNADRIEAARAKGTLPYFLKDNEGLINKERNETKSVLPIEQTEVFHSITFKSGGLVETPSIGKQSKAEEAKNLMVATEMAKYHGERIRLLPLDKHQSGPQVDAKNLITGKKLEIKKPEPQNKSGKNAIQNAVKQASRQDAKELIIYFDSEVTRRSVYEGLLAAFYGERGRKLDTLIIRFHDGGIKRYEVQKLKSWIETIKKRAKD